jgi:succinate-semialdehyde dehydrogenase/glutarate-semialdehyde dehydrogenase
MLRRESIMTVAHQLKDPTLFSSLCYIDGRWIGADSGATFPVDNPASGKVIGTVPLCGAVETTAAIAAAGRASSCGAKGQQARGQLCSSGGSM